MKSEIYFVTANDCGAVPGPKRDCFFRAGSLFAGTLIRLYLLILIIGFTCRLGASQLSDFTTGNAEFSFYPPGSVQLSADCKVDKIFVDHRKLGFFHVQLLPILVAQGVRLDLSGSQSDGYWSECFQSDWLPEMKDNVMEWRNVAISVQEETSPRVCADRAHPAKGKTSIICRLDNVTLKHNGAIWRASRAELCNENGRPRVLWHSGGGEFHWDLFTGEMVSSVPNPIKTEQQK